jgi:transcriptional regulator with XRE-family HTH domain
MTTKPSSSDVDLILKEMGSKIREKRKSVAKNYEDFAREHQFNKVTISRIENGENFTMSSLIQVLRVLDISIEDFFKGIK